MRKSDADLVAEHGDSTYRKALQASATSLRSDSKMTGIPRIRSALEEICALRALGSTVWLSKADTAAIARDTQTHNAVTAAANAATEAAKEAIGE